MSRRRAQVLAAGVIALAVAGTVVGLVVRDDRPSASAGNRVLPRAPATDKKSYAQLVAANYKVLTPARTARLLRFADAAYHGGRGRVLRKRHHDPCPLHTRRGRLRGQHRRPTGGLVVPGAPTPGHRLSAEVLHPRPENGADRSIRVHGRIAGHRGPFEVR